MPQNKFAIARYRIIDHLLRRNDYVKTAKMVEACFHKTGFRVSRRTIQLDIEAMKHDDFLGFHTPIGYDNSMKAYYYETDCHVLDTTSRFTFEDIQVIKYLFDICKDRIPYEDHLLFQDIIIKMELLID